MNEPPLLAVCVRVCLIEDREKERKMVKEESDSDRKRMWECVREREKDRSVQAGEDWWGTELDGLWQLFEGAPVSSPSAPVPASVPLS